MQRSTLPQTFQNAIVRFSYLGVGSSPVVVALGEAVPEGGVLCVGGGAGCVRMVDEECVVVGSERGGEGGGILERLAGSEGVRRMGWGGAAEWGGEVVLGAVP